MTCSAMLGLSVLLLSVTAPQQAGAIEIREVLALESVGSGGRVPIVTNALTAKLVNGEFRAPVEGEAFDWPGEARVWSKVEANAEGAFSGRAFRGGFAYASVPSDSDRVMVLEAAGHSYVYVNGEPRGGDPYSFGVSKHPVKLKKGENGLLFSVGRGTLRARLVEPDAPVYFRSDDATLPDLIVGEGGETWAGVILTNATEETLADVRVTAVVDGGEAVTNQVTDLPPLTSQRISVRFNAPVSRSAGKVGLTLRLEQWVSRRQVVATCSFSLDVRPLHELHKRTFVSAVDGSVQYYAVRPPFEANLATADALVLTVHGAGVEATGQAAAYGPKSWCWIVAPTNRRPYGFDWEDWGRLDALEALADAKRRYKPREDRIYLTGHSMGGHGAWYLGATYPDQWGAIGPAAGWVSFWSYGGAVRFDEPDAVESLLIRTANPSDTTKLLRNYLQHGVFVLHGDADQTVPVAQARQMREMLGAFHRDVDWHEEPGGGHWYDNTPEAGADCVDFGPMFEFFSRHRRRLSGEVRRVEFHTTSPQVSATSHWVTVVQQTSPLLPSSVVATNPVGTRRFEVETVNVAELELDIAVSPLGNRSGEVSVRIDGTDLTAHPSELGRLFLRRQGDAWAVEDGRKVGEKSPAFGGPFKGAFNNRFVFVYGTTGTPEENAWSFAKARYDAETWSYRGNGYVQVIPDTQVRADSELGQLGGLIRRSNYVVYGNEDTNSVAARLLAGSPLRVRRGRVTVGERTLEGNDLSVLAVRPATGRLAVAVDCFAVVGGTGLVGMRSTGKELPV